MRGLLLMIHLFLLCLTVRGQAPVIDLAWADTAAFTSANYQFLRSDTWRVYYEQRYETTKEIYYAVWKRAEEEYISSQDSIVKLFALTGKSTYGQWLTLTGNYAEGLPLFKEGLSEAESYFGPIKMLSSGYVGLGLAYSQFGDPYRALWAQNQAARIVDLHVIPGDQDYHLVGNKLGNLARVYAELNQIDKAFQLFRKAQEAYKVANVDGAGVCTYRYMARTAALSGNIPLAKKIMEEWNTVINSLAAVNNQCSMLSEGEYALIEQLADNLPEAIKHYEKAEEYAKNILEGDINWEYFKVQFHDIAALRQKYAAILLQVGQVAKAAELLKAADFILKQVTQDNNNYGLLNNHLLEARVAAANDDLERAQTLLEQSLSILTGAALVDWEAPALLPTTKPSPLLAKAYRIVAEIQAAAGSFSAETILANCEAGKDVLRQIQLSYVPDVAMNRLLQENAILFHLSITYSFRLALANNDEQALSTYFTALEQAKDQILRASVSTRKEVTYGLPQDLLEAEATARLEHRSYERLLTAEQGRKERKTDLIISYQQHLRDARTHLDSVMEVIDAIYPEYYALKFKSKQASLSQVRSTLATGEGMLCYYLTDEEVFGLLITPTATKPFKAAFSRARIAAFTETLTKPTEEVPLAWQQEAYALYEGLLGKVKQHPLTSLIIVPDKELNLLPWPVLLTKPASSTAKWKDLPYLLHQYSLQQEVSADIFYREVKNKRDQRPDYVYAGFAPVYAGGPISMRSGADTARLQRLFPEYTRQLPGKLMFNKDEVSRGSEMFGKQLVNIGSGATETAFKEFAGDAAVIHIAAHGITSAADPAASHLLFSAPASAEVDDGLLYAWEIYGMHLPADLTILSACETGTGALRDGTGVMSLARAFKYAGSKDVLMSRWPVNDRATFQLMTTFLSGLKAEDTKGEALRKAMIHHLETEKNPAYTHPYYWAGFSLVGPGRTLNTRTKNSWFWWGGGALLGVLGLLLIRKRKSVFSRD